MIKVKEFDDNYNRIFKINDSTGEEPENKQQLEI